MHRLSSSGSQLEHRRTSSSSTFGGLESGAASPALSLRLPGARDAEQQRTPAPVPMLRLPSRASLAAAASSGGGSGSSSPGLPQPAGLPGGGPGLAVPRLNLGAAPALPSPGAQSTASPGSSARLGRPPLPPSARSGMGATPRLTSRSALSAQREVASTLLPWLASPQLPFSHQQLQECSPPLPPLPQAGPLGVGSLCGWLCGSPGSRPAAICAAASCAKAGPGWSGAQPGCCGSRWGCSGGAAGGCRECHASAAA